MILGLTLEFSGWNKGIEKIYDKLLMGMLRFKSEGIKGNGRTVEQLTIFAFQKIFCF